MGCYGPPVSVLSWVVCKPYLIHADVRYSDVMTQVTVTKINIIGSAAACKKRMMELDGFAEADLPTAIGGFHEGRTCYDVLQDAIVANGGTPDYLNGKMPKDSCFIDGLPGAAAKGAPQSTVEAVHGAATHGDSPFPFYPTPLGTLL